MRAERNMMLKTTPRTNPRRDEEPEIGPELELELGAELPVVVTDPDEDGIVTFVTYM